MEKINLVDFQKRKLKNFFVCVYVITKKIKIRTETSIAEMDLNLLYGIDILGYRQVLGIYFDITLFHPNIGKNVSAKYVLVDIEHMYFAFLIKK